MKSTFWSLAIAVLALLLATPAQAAQEEEDFECIPSHLTAYVADACEEAEQVLCVKGKNVFKTRLNKLAKRLTSTESAWKQEKYTLRAQKWIKRKINKVQKYNAESVSCRSMLNCEEGTFQLAEAGIYAGLYEPTPCFRDQPGDSSYLCERIASVDYFKASITCSKWFGDM